MKTAFGVNIDKIKIVPKDSADLYRRSKEFLILLWTSKDTYEEIHIFVDDALDKFILPGNLEQGTLLVIGNCRWKHSNYWEVHPTESDPLVCLVIRPTDWNNGIYQDLVNGHERKFQIDLDSSTRDAANVVIKSDDLKKNLITGIKYIVHY